MDDLGRFKGKVDSVMLKTLGKYEKILNENAPDEVLNSLNLGQEGRNNSKIGIINENNKNVNKKEATNKREGVGQDR